MIQGSIVAIVTPMLAQGEIDFETFDRLIEWHIASGTDAIVVAGTTGESPTLSEEEHCALMRHCVDKVAGRLPVIAGTGSNSTREAIYFTRAALEYGADACLLVAPYYNKPSQEGLFQHFKKVAKEVDIKQILYNVPSRTGCDLLPSTVSRLADMENVVGIKEASGDMVRCRELLKLCGDRIRIYGGDDATARQLLLEGGHGNISVTANLVPDQMRRMCALAMQGHADGALAIDAGLAGLHELLFVEGNPVPVKWAMAKLGMIGPGIRLPLVALSAGFHAVLSDAMRQAGLLK